MLSAVRRIALKWLVLAVAFIALLSAINYGLGFVPFTPQWTAKRDRAENASLRAQVSSLERTAEGNAAIGHATETLHTREIFIREGTAEAVARDRSAPDATVPLTPERANRLHDADRVLCINTGLCAADADASGGSPEALPDSDPAG